MPETARHSGLGIVSFVLAAVAALAIVGAFVFVAPAGFRGDSAELAVSYGVASAALGVELISLGLAVGALFQPNRRRVFAVAGLSISDFVLAVFAVAAIVGSGLA